MLLQLIDTEINGNTVPLNLECRSFTVMNEIADNIRVNKARSLPRFVKPVMHLQSNMEPLAVVAGGPSINKTMDEIRGFKNILACGSVHDHLVRNGIIPTHTIVVDPVPTMKDCLTLPQRGCTYLIASQCNPNLFEALAGYDVEMWHFKGQGAPSAEAEAELLEGEPSIAFGCTVGMNSIQIAILMGFRHLHFFGLDSCYDGDVSHAYNMADKRTIEYGEAWIGNRRFITDMGLLAQAEHFFNILNVDAKFLEVTVHGDGLIAEMIRQMSYTVNPDGTTARTLQPGETDPNCMCKVA